MVRRGVGVVFQNHHLLFDRTVYENVALPLEIAGFARREASRRVRAALSKVGLSDKENKYPNTLSGGEQQRVGIARAVVNKPPILLADEPTGNLDPENAAEALGLIRETCMENGAALLLVSHDKDVLGQFEEVHDLSEINNASAWQSGGEEAGA